MSYQKPPGAWRARLACVLLAVTGACMTPPAPEATTPVRTTVRTLDRSMLTLGPNDVLRVEVYGHPEISTDEKGTTVDNEGYLHVPLAGAVLAEGRTVSQLVEAIEAALSRYFKEPDVSAWVIVHASKQFYVAGHVHEPGPKPLDRPMTLLQAFSTGGGARPGADREEVFLIRNHDGETEIAKFNMKSPDANSQIAVQPNDVLFMRQTGSGTFQEQVLPILQGFGFVFNPVIVKSID